MSKVFKIYIFLILIWLRSQNHKNAYKNENSWVPWEVQWIEISEFLKLYWLSNLTVIELAHCNLPLQELTVKFSGNLRVSWCHIGSLKSTTVGVFTPWKWANATNQGTFTPRDYAVNHLQAYTQEDRKRIWRKHLHIHIKHASMFYKIQQKQIEIRTIER